jgi:hypothetical protein
MPDQLLFRFEQQDYPVPDYKVEHWINEGRVVLDIDKIPIKKYHNIPLTLSSKMEAYLMEMIIRMDLRITQRDLRARMPHTVQTANGAIPLFRLNALGMRMKRFRLENACPPWNERDGNCMLKAFVMSLLSEESLKRNSTREFNGLTKLQQEIIIQDSRGRNLPTASSRKINLATGVKRAGAWEKVVKIAGSGRRPK